MPARGYSHTPKKKRRVVKAPSTDERRGQSAKRAAPARREREELRRDVARARKKVRRGKGPKADSGDVRKNTRVDAKAELRATLRDSARTARKRKLKKVEEPKTLGGLAENALRNVRDIVTGLPATARELSKITALAAPGATSGKSGREGVKAAKNLKEGIQRDDPVYALGEAAVKKIKGDDKGAAKALDRAGDKAYERPVDAAAYAAGGAGAAGRGATAVKHKGKGGTAAATARPPKRVEGEGKSSPEKVKRQREAARAEVRVKQGTASEKDKQTAAKITRKPDVRQEQRYSPNAATRTVQKARENRKAKKGKDPFRENRKAKKGKDPFQATPRKARKIRKRRFDETSRNAHAGGLAREQRAADDARKQRKRLKTPEKLTAAQLLANKRVREGKEAEDLEALRKTASAREGGDRNADVLARVTVDDLTDAEVRKVAAEMRAGLTESEARAKGEGFFDGRDGRATNPEFVAALQPLLARGEVVQRTQGDKPPAGKKESPPLPEARKAPVPERAPKDTSKADAAPQARRLRPDAEQELRRAAVRTLRRKIREVDAKIAAIPMQTRQAPVYRPKAGETPEQAAARAIEGDFAESGNRSGRTSGQAPDKTRVDVKGEAKGMQRRKQRRAVPLDKDRARLVALREERKKLQEQLDRTIVAGRHHAAKREVPADTRGKIAPGLPNAPKGAKRDVYWSPEHARARIAVARSGGMKPDPNDVKAAAFEPSTGAGVVSPVSPAGRVAPAAVERKDRADDDQQDKPDAESGMVEQPAVHDRAASHRGARKRKRTAVRVDRDGYYWTSGPKAGQRVVEADLSGEQGAFIRGLEHDSHPTTDLRQPKAGHGYSAEDAILGDLTDDRVLATRLDRERQITLIRLARSVEENFAHRTSRGQTRFTHQRAQQLAGRLGDGWAPLRVDAQESVIVPAEIADRWTRQISRPSRTERTGRYVTRQFIRTVLPFSMTWQAGNVADLYTRLVAADARFAVPGLAGASGRELVGAVEAAMRDLDPHLADEITQALKGHFGARSTVAPLKFSDITEDARSPLIRAAGQKVSAVREVAGVKQLADAGRSVTDKAFSAGTKAESAMVRRAAGVALQQYAKALGHDVADHQALARKLATEFKDDPAKLLEFQRRTLEITGDYVTRGPGLKLIQHTTVPFVQWIRAANKFVWHTLPAKHPYKTAFMLWAASITEQQRRELGLSNYITPAEARKLGLKAPQEGYLAGALGLPGGKSLPVSPLTSFGEAAGIIEGVSEAVTKDGDDGLETLLGNRVFPFVQTPIRKGARHGKEVGASRVVEAFVPGAKQARRVMEGERPHPRSTLIDPIGTGGQSTTDRILAGMTAPVGREYPEPVKKGEIKPSANRSRAKRTPAGKTLKYVHTTPSGKKVVRRIVRRPDR